MAQAWNGRFVRQADTCRMAAERPLLAQTGADGLSVSPLMRIGNTDTTFQQEPSEPHFSVAARAGMTRTDTMKSTSPRQGAAASARKAVL